MSDITANIEKVKERINQAAKRVNRDPSEIKLLPATKDVPVELIEKAIQAGITEIGENKIQEASSKYDSLSNKYPNLTWHMIGHLQTNKVKKAVEIFSIIQSVDSLRLAEEIDRKIEGRPTFAEASVGKGKRIEVLIEVNTSGEENKSGAKPEETLELVRIIAQLKNLKINGLMTIGPLTDDKSKTRKAFKVLKSLRDEIVSAKIPDVQMKWLSMGMSDDLEIAVEEGSNLVRIGTAIFGIEHKH